MEKIRDDSHIHGIFIHSFDRFQDKKAVQILSAFTSGSLGTGIAILRDKEFDVG
jgi:hypothetical protein